MTHMFEAAAQRLSFSRLVSTSSETVYGGSQMPYGDRPVPEDDFCDPYSHSFTYAVMKLLNEHMGRRYVERLGANIVCARPPVVFGHGRKRSAVMWRNISRLNPPSASLLRFPLALKTRDTWILGWLRRAARAPRAQAKTRAFCL